MAQFSQYPRAPGSSGTNQDVNMFDASGNAINSTSNALDVSVKNASLPVTATQLPAALGQTNMAGSLSVTVANNQSSVPVSGTISISGTVPVSSTQLPAALGQGLMAASLPVVIASNQSAISVTDTRLPAALGQTTMAASLPVVIASNQSAVPVSGTVAISGTVAATQSGTWNIGTVTTVTGVTTVSTLTSITNAVSVTPTRGATATLANVAGSASSVTLLASNANRLGAMCFNDSSAILYLKFGSAASTTSFTVQVQANGYYELPGPTVYSGIITGIWASATGSARMTEVT